MTPLRSQDQSDFAMDQECEMILAGCVWKKILTPGRSKISEKPSERSICRLKIENVRRAEEEESPNFLDLAKCLGEQNSTILTGESEVTVTIGEADSEIDRRVEMAVQLMKDYEKSLVIISIRDPIVGSEPGKISFEATLLKHEKFKPIWEWTRKEKYDIAMKYKNMGVQLFKDSESGSLRYKDAFHRFSKACKILITLEPMDDFESDKELFDDIINLRLKLYNNMAACQGKHNNYYHVIELCSKVFSRDDKNVLALFRRGYAYGELKDYDRAVEDFEKLLSIEPNNKQAILKLNHYRSCLKQVNKHCNEMVKRMFR